MISEESRACPAQALQLFLFGRRRFPGLSERIPQGDQGGVFSLRGDFLPARIHPKQPLKERKESPGGDRQGQNDPQYSPTGGMLLQRDALDGSGHPIPDIPRFSFHDYKTESRRKIPNRTRIAPRTANPAMVPFRHIL